MDQHAMPSRRSIHSAKWHRCLGHVKHRSKKRGRRVRSPHAVCTASLKEGTFKPSYLKRRKNPAKRKYTSTIQPYTGPKERKYYSVQEQDGVKVGRRYKVDGKLLQVMHISKYEGDEWSARVWYEGRPDHVNIPLKDIVRALHSRAHHPVQMCYAVGPGPLRRLKANPAPEKFYVFVSWTGRGWLRYDGENFSTRQPGPGAVFTSARAAWKKARELRKAYPKQLRKRVLYVTDRWPTKI